MTTRIAVVVSAALTALLINALADASLSKRQRHSLHDAQQPRIVSVYTKSGQLFIAGRNLPSGDGVEVRLGDELLTVVTSSKSLLITNLPSINPGDAARLTVEHGVRRAEIRGDAVRWGLLLPVLH
ncbi:MAG: hypothetical protein KJO13_06005 [Gammaproteobacteria bacterium]|nr:hypothetical protein [Gammaproteobacteria bacterium]